MSNISKNSGTNVGIELSSIAVTGENGGRGECWKFNISNQFPIIPSNIENGEVVLDVDSPHKGYSIQTVMENGKMNGESIIFNPDHIQIASLVFVDGVANGFCELYDDNGNIVFEGYLKNGYREGKGKEYDENGNVIFEGFYEQGKRMNIVELKEMKGYWKEMNEKNEIVSICQKDEEGNNDGICYFYSNGVIDRISEWKNGEELNVLKRFEGKKMIEFVNGVKRYEGEFRDSIKHNYPREGNGKEYDVNGKNVIYQGQYWNGKRQGNGIVYENGKKVYDGMWMKGYRFDIFVLIVLVAMIVMTVISFLLLFYIGIVVLVIDIIFWIGAWLYFPSIQLVFGCKKGKKSKTVQMKNDLKYAKQLDFLTLSLFLIIFVNIITVLILFLLTIPSQTLQKQCLGSNVVGSMVIESNHCNTPLISTFNPQNDDIEQIVIGDDCFNSVNEFDVNGLNGLKSLVIGMNSFGKDASGSFHLMNCNEFESIEIGSGSFIGFVGLFELRNLPKLSSISLGENVFEKSFSVTFEGMNVVFDLNRSSCTIFDHFVRK